MPVEDFLLRSFFARSPVVVARELIGFELCQVSSDGEVRGRVVETEAYLGRDDAASHAGRGPTKRSLPMFEQVGRAYVYQSYGVHWCLNVVAHMPEEAGAVLIRALEPLAGVERMASRRGGRGVGDLCNGPGKLTQALGIDGSYNRADMLRGSLRWVRGDPLGHVVCTSRIGISRARERPWRFIDSSSSYLSRPHRPREQ